MESLSPAIVTNRDYADAWANPTNRRIMARVAKLYRGKMPREDIVYCSQMALFRCMKSHRDSSGNRFTTSLYQYTKWQLQNGLRNYYRELQRQPPMQSIDNFEHLTIGERIMSFDVQDCLLKLTPQERHLIEQTYVYNKSLRELEKEEGISRQTINRKLRKAVLTFKQLWSLENVQAVPG